MEELRFTVTDLRNAFLAGSLHEITMGLIALEGHKDHTPINFTDYIKSEHNIDVDQYYKDLEDSENYKQLCVVQGTIVGKENAKEFEMHVLNEFGFRIKYETEVKTLPDIDPGTCETIPGTGGRNDVFCYMHKDDTTPFAVTRLKADFRWWEDVVKYNNGARLYGKEFVAKYPFTW